MRPKIISRLISLLLFPIALSLGCGKPDLPRAPFTIEGALRQYHCAEANFILDRALEVISRVDRQEYAAGKKQGEDQSGSRRFARHYAYCLEHLKVEVQETTTLSELGVRVAHYTAEPEQLLRYYLSLGAPSTQLLVEMRTNPGKFFDRQDDGKTKIEEGIDAGKLHPEAVTSDATLVEEDGQWRVYVEYHGLRGMIEAGRIARTASKLLERGQLDEAFADYRKAYEIINNMKFATPHLQERRVEYLYLFLQYLATLAEKQGRKLADLQLPGLVPFLRVMPMILDNRLYGYQIRVLSPTAERAGLRVADTIQKINDFIPAAGPADDFESFLHELKNARTMIVNRNKGELATYALPVTTDLRW